MAKTSLANIKNWFLTGLKPTQTQFWSVFDSFRHKDEKIPQGDVDQLAETLDAKAEKQAFETHLNDAQAHNSLFNAKVDKIAGKGLSTEDLTSELLALIQSALQRVDVQDLPDSPETELPASANQVRLLNVAVTNILNLLNSDDVTLDELQEVVDFIKANREDLQNLAIPNIAGLVDALAAKVDVVAGKALSTNDFTDAYKAQLDNPPVTYERVQDFSSNATIVGAIDGVNTIYDSSQNFEPGTMEIMLNGVDLSIDDDYTETGPNEVTFVEAPETGDKIIFRYQKLIA
ncbi:hypothetical protein [Leeuwenhoekiella parthenopeia]|uniref:Uncharacterized protein n=1 Tax=Leeuwenhoekiella parthenopeia TaxID=2890320 RepID=A0ABS8GN44_9FLAO|nr:hypothetical protein [Leeuwenhoekiella parthenopeia]MCC4211340.1 hypothetical protein [Leeuwenhoekiella parthenopeia]